MTPQKGRRPMITDAQCRKIIERIADRELTGYPVTELELKRSVFNIASANERQRHENGEAVTLVRVEHFSNLKTSAIIKRLRQVEEGKNAKCKMVRSQNIIRVLKANSITIGNWSAAASHSIRTHIVDKGGVVVAMSNRDEAGIGGSGDMKKQPGLRAVTVSGRATVMQAVTQVREHFTVDLTTVRTASSFVLLEPHLIVKQAEGKTHKFPGGAKMQQEFVRHWQGTLGGISGEPAGPFAQMQVVQLLTNSCRQSKNLLQYKVLEQPSRTISSAVSQQEKY